MASTERRFRGMGSDIHVIVVGPAGLADLAASRIDELERRWSRFLPDSEVSRLNASAGRPLEVSADTALLIRTSVEAWRLTGGGFDPTLLDALRHAGYDRSFDELADRRALAADAGWRERFWSRPAVTDIVVDGHTVMLPAGIGFDPGGIGKGLAADLVTAELLAHGAEGACVNMGGDLRAGGLSPEGPGWTLGIEHPWRAEPVAVVGLMSGAVATSTVLRRTWTVGGERRHHLIDPATGEPSTSDVAMASIVAGEAWIAEVLAKAVLLRGGARAFDLLDADTAALVVDEQGNLTVSANFVDFTGGVAPPAVVDFDPLEALP